MTRTDRAPSGIHKTVALTVLSLAGFTLSACLSGSGGDSPVTGKASGNNAPSLSGSPPASTAVGESWSFTPNASDPDGDALTFTVDNKPHWTSFSATNGALSGAPKAGDEGTYSGITITASDGSAEDTLSFSVTVNQMGTGSVSLSWQAPTENDDGSPLTDLAAFKIYYGKAYGNWTNQIRIDNPGVSSYVVENLSPATWYFVTTAINSSNIESRYSASLRKTVD